MMINFIERGFFSIVQKLGLIFAIISFALIVFLGMFSYEKINSQATDEIKAPVIELAKYQNPISLQIDAAQPGLILENTISNNQTVFDQEFDTHVDQILAHLQALPDGVIGKEDMQFKIKVMIKIKTNNYNPSLRLSYVQSLSKLTKQLVNVGGDKINIDDFLHWHDQEFVRQVDVQTQQNLMKIGTARSDQMAGFMSLGMAGIALGFFIMFVMMLVMFRIEKNTRA